MYTNAPTDYDCPFCRLVGGEDLTDAWSKQTDIVYQTRQVTAFVSAAWWPNNSGHVIVIPNRHIENIYTMPSELHGEIFEVARIIALAFKEVYKCDGTSTRQHNEPAGNQEVWHYHLHVFPRYYEDQLYLLTRQRRIVPPVERYPFAERLRGFFSTYEVAD